jgi:hypothetical protein
LIFARIWSWAAFLCAVFNDGAALMFGAIWPGAAACLCAVFNDVAALIFAAIWAGAACLCAGVNDAALPLEAGRCACCEAEDGGVCAAGVVASAWGGADRIDRAKAATSTGILILIFPVMRLLLFRPAALAAKRVFSVSLP